ncbi:MAG TPA: carbohydrate porin [Candidatus Acidoferrales bacterium]|nr:carbohydrate porin [Candidatus Acidoferrales bacterium]
MANRMAGESRAALALRQPPGRLPGLTAALLLSFLLPARLPAQAPQTSSAPSAATAPAAATDSPTTLFPPLDSNRFWVSGQANFIFQAHPAFPASYTGAHSLSPQGQSATSRVLTLFTGVRVSPTAEFLFDVEETGGHGIGEAFGLAGFTNLDVVRNPTLSKTPYIARLMWHQIIPLGGKRVAAERNPLSLFGELPERRLELRMGKFDLADFFDANSYASDSRLQFLNWTVDNNGAYDYAADTRGYTWGAMLEFDDRHWSARFAETLMPKVANGIHLDADLARAHAENVEFELRGSLVPRRQGTLRLLGFVNHANMGSYSVAVADFLAGRTPLPDVTAHPLRTTIKYGFGVNFEQPLSDWLGVFGRWGWNEGQHESYVYTEVDQTALAGLGADGKRWRRKFDRAGLAFVSSGISRDHQQYLKLGGVGFLLGDGRLNYGREDIVETYYTLHLWRGFYPSFGLQQVNNPGYNRDRGPLLAPDLRLNIEF